LTVLLLPPAIWDQTATFIQKRPAPASPEVPRGSAPSGAQQALETAQIHYGASFLAQDIRKALSDVNRLNAILSGI
jgi:hypothetical protein